MKKLIWLGLLLALLSSVGHFYLSKRAYELKAGTASEKSLCHIGKSLSCDSALLSPYADFFGVSLSSFGLGLNLVLSVLIFWLLFFGLSPAGKNTLFYLSLFSAFASLVMAGLSLLYHIFCPVCFLLYLGSFLIPFLLLVTLRQNLLSPLTFISENLRSKNFYIFIGSILFCGLFFHIYFVNSLNLKNKEKELSVIFQEWKTEKITDIDPSSSLLQRGEKTNPMLIVKFVDPLCPACQKSHKALKRFLNHFPDVRVYFYVYPLDGVCNPSIKQKREGLRCQLSQSIFCAEKQGKGWKVQDFIFTKQTLFLQNQGDEKKIKELIKEMLLFAGVSDIDSFSACIKSPESLKAVQDSALAGEKAQIEGTPSFFVNGQAISYSPKLLILRAIYNHLN